MPRINRSTKCPTCKQFTQPGHVCPLGWHVSIAETDPHHDPTEAPALIYAPRADLAAQQFIENWDNYDKSRHAIARAEKSVSIVVSPNDSPQTRLRYIVHATIIPHYTACTIKAMLTDVLADLHSKQQEPTP